MKHVLLALLLLCLLGCREQILHDLDESRANQAQLILMEASIRVEKLRQGKFWAISVPTEEVHDALALLEKERFLKKPEKERGESSAALLQTSEDRVQQREKERCLRTEQSLEQIPGVLEARVHLSSDHSAPRLLGNPAPARGGSVLLLLRDGVQLDSDSIKSFVSAAVGINPEKLSLLFESAKASPSSTTIRSKEESDFSRKDFGRLEYLAALGASLPLVLFGLFSIVRSRRKEKEELSLDNLRSSPLMSSVEPFPLDSGIEQHNGHP